MIPRATENTISTVLKEELERLGVKAEPFASIQTPTGRKEVDLLLSNAGIYPVEAKFTEDRLVDAIAKVQNDYLRFHELLGVKGGFALLYPEQLRRPMPVDAARALARELSFKAVLMFAPKDSRNFSVHEGTLQEIARILAEQVLTPPSYIEPSIDYIVRSLRDSAAYILNGLRHLAGAKLEGVFGGRDVFANILAYEDEKTYPVEDLRLAAAYLLINQLLFYHVLARTHPKRFPEIDTDAITQPFSLRKYFDAVLDVNYRTVFSYDVASVIPHGFTGNIGTLINVIRGLSPEKVRRDLLGTIFHDLVPFEVRKSVAAFYTNIMAGELLARLSVEDWDCKVADFACGSGGLLVAAYRVKKDLLEKQRPFTELNHQGFIEEDLLGVDVMPFAANVAACHLALQSPEYFTNKVQVAVWDSTELEPGRVIPSATRLDAVLSGQVGIEAFSRRCAEELKGPVVLGQERPEGITLRTYHAIVMNPPFTRQERIPQKYKDRLSERFKEYAEYLHGQLAYYGYFILLADKFLEPGGRLGLVLPAAFLRVRSAEGLRRLLSERYNIEYVTTGSKRLNFSEATWRREILFVATKAGADRAAVVAALKRLPAGSSDAERFAAKIAHVEGQYEDHELSALPVAQEEMRRDLEWFRFIASFQRFGVTEMWKNISGRAKGLVRIGNLADWKKTFKRGVETARGMKSQAVFIPNSPERMIRKADEWVLRSQDKRGLSIRNRYTLWELTVPQESVVPALRTIAGNESMDVTGRTDYVVVRDFEGSERFFRGERVTLRGILPTWERYVGERTGNLAVLRRFVVNAPGTVHLCYYSSQPFAPPGMAWVGSLSDEDAKVLCLYFNSSINLVQILDKRIEDVWVDVHKYILRDLLIPDLAAMPGEEKEALASLFDSVRLEKFPTLKEQYQDGYEQKKRIDYAVLKALGFQEAEVEELLADLYEVISGQFEALDALSPPPSK